MAGWTVPHAVSTFVGRTEELAHVRRLLLDRRLVTLSWVGGAGKSRLAAHTLHDPAITARYPARHWVDLGAVTGQMRVAHVCAEALGARVDPGGDPLAAIETALGDSAAVVCLDTCEHLLDAAAVVAEHLLAGCPGVRVLATSREPLGVPGEAVWRVPAMTPQDAAALLIDRAALVGGDIDLDGEREVVTAICSRLDHLPLAIELAATWVRLLPPTQLLAGLQDRYALLTGSESRAPQRHRAIRASIQWSHELLTDAERTVFRRLGVFSGPFGLEDAAEVCNLDNGDPDEVVACLARLVDKSLVMAGGPAGNGSVRLLDSVREFAVEHLERSGERDPLHQRHLTHYLDEMLAVDSGLNAEQDAWRERAAAHSQNAVAAIEWGLQQAPHWARRAAELAVAMTMGWFLSGQTTVGLSLLERAAAAVDPQTPLAAEVRSAAAMLEMVSGRTVPGAVLSPESDDEREDPARERQRTPGSRVRARNLLVRTYRCFFVDFARCERTAVAACAAGRLADDAFIEDFALVMGAYSLNARDRFAESYAMAQPALDRARARGDRFCIAFAIGLWQYAYLQTGRLSESVQLGRQMVQTIAPLSEYFGLGTLTSNLALAEVLRGEVAAARRIMRPIVSSLESAPEVDIVGFQVPLGHASLLEGSWQDAVDWFSRALSRLEGVEVDWTAARCLPGVVTALRELGRTDEAARWLERGRAVARVQHSPQFDSDLAEQQALLLRERDPAMAFDLLQQSLTIRASAGLRTYLPDSLDLLAQLGATTDPSAQAVRLLAASSNGRTEMGRPRIGVATHRHREAARSLRRALGPASFGAAWDEGSALTLEQAAELASRGRGTRGRPRSGWSSLTRTELQVVQLASAGRSNTEIAAAMFVSRSTVKTHLSHAYAKLGVANRTELATLAATRPDDPPR